jgi:hypothetical protein
LADRYSKGWNTVRAKVEMKKPLNWADINTRKKYDDLLNELWLDKKDWQRNKENWLARIESNKKAQEALKQSGYDWVILKRKKPEWISVYWNEYMVFDAKNIKTTSQLRKERDSLWETKKSVSKDVSLSWVAKKLYDKQWDKMILSHISTSPVIKKIEDVKWFYTADNLIPWSDQTIVIVSDLKWKWRGYYNWDHIAIDTKVFNWDKKIRDQVLKHELEHVWQMGRWEITREKPSLKPWEKWYKDQPHEIWARKASGQTNK